jgi:VCBS repeat-containing protein
MRIGQPISLTDITAGATNETQTVTLSVASNNSLLIPNPTINYSSPATTGTLVFTPVANSNGTATLTLTANDGGASDNITTRQIVVTVTPVADPPVITHVPNQTINEDGATSALPFTLTDFDSPVSSLSVLGGSSDPVLVHPRTSFSVAAAKSDVTVVWS